MAPIIKDSAKVDSASIISGLGYTPFNETGDTLTGTGGAGFYGAIPQSSAPSTPGSGFRLYANASGLFEWKGTNGFTRTFDGATNTANRTYTLPNASGTIALEGTLTSLANPTIQNGFYQFTQNTKPTQRAVGVPLVAGDRWYKTDDGTEWFWNGTYWLSKELYIIAFPLTLTWGASGIRYSGTLEFNNTWSGLFFEQYSGYVQDAFAVPWDQNNYSTFTVNVLSFSATAFPMLTFVENNRTGNVGITNKIVKDLNYFRSLPDPGSGSLGARYLSIVTVKIGSGTTAIAAQEHVTYRGVAP